MEFHLHSFLEDLLLSWHARTTDLLEEASVEIGLKLTPLSSPTAFLNLMFRKKCADPNYGPGQHVTTTPSTTSGRCECLSASAAPQQCVISTWCGPV